MVDPIDGTTNFIHGFPFSAISIGLAVNKQAAVGVVYNFNLDQLFAAKMGGGATLNGKPIKASKCSGKVTSCIPSLSPDDGIPSLMMGVALSMMGVALSLP
jgi:myo-inositol-1(or 4)-monophosphatase